MVDGGSGVDEGDEDLALVHHIHFVLLLGLVHKGLLHLEDHLGAVVDLLGIVNHLCTFTDIVLVVIEGAVTCVTLHEYFKAVFYEFAHGFGRCSNTSLVVHDFFGNTNNHNIKFKVVVVFQ